MKNNNHSTIGILIGLLFVAFFIIFKGCTTHKKAKPCTQCPQYSQKIDSLKLKIYNDSITMKAMESDYLVLWEENQIFSSMLSEIESSPKGHVLLKNLWEKHSN